MRIACPQCRAEYEVPDHTVAQARAVRCARCGAQWSPAPPEPPPAEARPAPIPAPEPGPEPPEAPPPPPIAVLAEPAHPPSPIPPAAPPEQRPASRRGPALAWAASLALLAGAGAAAYAWRDQVVRAWPPSERLYAALRVPPATPAATPSPAPHAPAH